MQRAHLFLACLRCVRSLFSPQAKSKRASAALSDTGKLSMNELKKIPVATQTLSLANMDCLTFNMAVEEATRLGYAASVKAASNKVLLSRESCADSAGGRGRSLQASVKVRMIVPAVSDDEMERIKAISASPSTLASNIKEAAKFSPDLASSRAILDLGVGSVEAPATTTAAAARSQIYDITDQAGKDVSSAEQARGRARGLRRAR